MSLGAAAGIGCVLLLAGCSGFPNNFKDPDIRLDRVILRGAGPTGGVIDLNLQIENRNGFDLQGSKLQVGFDVEGSHLGDIEYRSALRVGKGETASLTVPLRFQWSGVSAAVRAALGSGDLPYAMKGQVMFDTPFGKRTVPFTREGRAPLIRPGGIVPVPGS